MPCARRGVSAAYTISAPVLIAGTAYAQTGGQSGQHGMDMQGAIQSMMPDSSESASIKDYKNVNMEMMMNAPKDFSGHTDMDFARQMIAHHQGGIDMARVELQHGKGSAMRNRQKW